MRAGTIARVYAETLFRSADRHGEVESVDESVRGLSAVLRESPEFRSFLSAVGPFVDRIQEMRHYDVRGGGAGSGSRR